MARNPARAVGYNLMLCKNNSIPASRTDARGFRRFRERVRLQG